MWLVSWYINHPLTLQRNNDDTCDKSTPVVAAASPSMTVHPAKQHKTVPKLHTEYGEKATLASKFPRARSHQASERCTKKVDQFIKAPLSNSEGAREVLPMS